uniref:Uncharacterized protein n=1 Tax=Arundo donax TaxID=35708 RepID=A0A0A9EU80_ARUDO
MCQAFHLTKVLNQKYFCSIFLQFKVFMLSSEKEKRLETE